MDLLSKPYPLICDSNQFRRLSIIFGLFVFLFLLVFRPFGLVAIQGNWQYLILLGYGFITSLIMLLNYFLLPQIFPRYVNESKWTTGRELLFILWQIFLIGITNLGFTFLLGMVDFSWHSILTFQFFTLGVGIFPVTGMVLFNYGRLKSHYEKEALILNDQSYKTNPKETILKLEGTQEGEILQLPLSHLLYISSADNYLVIMHIKEGKPCNTVFRCTLKQIEKQVEGIEMPIRCHRSYLVNLQLVDHFTGNSQGLQLRFHKDVPPIPVSRAYVKTIKQYFPK